MSKEKQSPSGEKDSKTVPEQNAGGGNIAKTPPDREIGGRKGPEPTRYGDWELSGKCVDF